MAQIDTTQPQLPLPTSIRWAVDKGSPDDPQHRSLIELFFDGNALGFHVVDAAGNVVLRVRIAGSGIFGPETCMARARTDHTPPTTEAERDVDERALDLGIPDMLGYAPLFDELEAEFGSRFTDALWQPNRLGAARDRWPLTAAEVSDLLGRISPELACPTETIAGWTAAGERLPPVPNGPGRIYFARDLVPIAHRLWQVAKIHPQHPRLGTLYLSNCRWGRQFLGPDH